MTPFAADCATQLPDMTATLYAELSPRKLDLVGVGEVLEILTKHGIRNRKYGTPLGLSWVSRLTLDDPTFPKPWIEKSARRYWRRADVEQWVPTYIQKDGARPKKADLLVAVIDSQPDRVWTLRELMVEVHKSKILAGINSHDLQGLASRMVQRGRIRRLQRGIYQSLRGQPKEGGK